MRRLIFQFIAVIALALLATSVSVRADSSTEAPLQVTAPAGWNVKYDNSKGIEFYTVSGTPKQPGDFCLLMFSRWPAGGGPEQIPGFLDSMASMFPKVVSQQGQQGMQIKTTTRGDISGGAITGKYVEFDLNKGSMTMTQVMFMFSVGPDLWQGQFSGTSGSWAVALDILEGIKKSQPL